MSDIPSAELLQVLDDLAGCVPDTVEYDDDGSYSVWYRMTDGGVICFDFGPKTIMVSRADGKGKSLAFNLRAALLEAENRGREQMLTKIAEVARAVGWQANTGASETAGHIVSVLTAKPDLLRRFMAEGSELFIDGSFGFQDGALTYIAKNGTLFDPVAFRASVSKDIATAIRTGAGE